MWRLKLLGLAIIFFILILLVNDSAVLLRGEIRYWSLFGFKGLNKIYLPPSLFKNPQSVGVPLVIFYKKQKNLSLSGLKESIKEFFHFQQWSVKNINEYTNITRDNETRKHQLTFFFFKTNSLIYCERKWVAVKGINIEVSFLLKDTHADQMTNLLYMQIHTTTPSKLIPIEYFK